MGPSKFYIVECVIFLRPDVAQYVRVPDKRLMWIDNPNYIAPVACPEGNPADTEELARSNRSNPFYPLTCTASVKFVTSK